MEWEPNEDDPPENANEARNAMLKWINSQNSESDSWSDSGDQSNSKRWNNNWSIRFKGLNV